MGRLDGKVAVNTGAGRGIGRATATRVAAEGASVVANDVDADPVEETATLIRGGRWDRPLGSGAARGRRPAGSVSRCR
jgi:3-oxoacyl-[acyl-carrier protein] reductase